MLDEINRKYHVNAKQISSPEPLVDENFPAIDSHQVPAWTSGRTLQRRKNVSILHITSFISAKIWIHFPCWS